MKNKTTSVYLFTLLVTSIMMLSCGPADVNQSNCDHVVLKSSDLKEMNSTKVLLLIADDRSGSMTSSNQPRRMTESQYKKLLNAFIDKGYTGSVAARVIGDPENTGFDSHLDISAEYKAVKIPDDIKLSDKARLICVNKRLKDTSEAIRSNNKKNVEDYMQDVIKPIIIDYKPHGKDRTNLETAFRDIEKELNNSVDFGYDKILLIVMSDGQDSNRSANLTLNTSADFKVALIGWPQDKPVHNSDDKYFSSCDELINWFKNVKL